MLSALFAQAIAPFNPYDLASLDLMNAHLGPSWTEMGDERFWLGTDDQGRDLYSTILYGLRLSLKIGLIFRFALTHFGSCFGFNLRLCRWAA